MKANGNFTEWFTSLTFTLICFTKKGPWLCAKVTYAVEMSLDTLILSNYRQASLERMSVTFLK
jgi:hypothetical protein